MKQSTIKLAIPKGSLQKKTAEFLGRAGFDVSEYGADSRNYRPDLGVLGLQVKVLRPQEIPILVERGRYDLGISGFDWYLESMCKQVDVEIDLSFGRVDIVLAVPDDWDDVTNAIELFHKFRYATSDSPLRVWTEYINLTEELVLKYEKSEPDIISPYLQIRGGGRRSSIQIYHSFGATESKPPEDGDAIVDNTETGRTLRANGLKIVHKVLADSTAHLLVYPRSKLIPEKRELLESVIQMFRSAAPRQIDQRSRFGGHLDLH